MDKLNKKWYGQNRSSRSSYYSLGIQLLYTAYNDKLTIHYSYSIYYNHCSCSLFIEMLIVPPQDVKLKLMWLEELKGTKVFLTSL